MSTLLSVAHRAAGALETVTSRAAAAEDAHGAAQEAAEEARQTANDLHLELSAAQAECKAMQLAAERESEVAKGWEDAAARAESAWMESQQELRAARVAAAAERERADRDRGKLESTIQRLSDSDQQNAKLDEVIQRLATRSFGPVLAGDDALLGGVGVSSNSREGIPRYRAEVSPVHRGHVS